MIRSLAYRIFQPWSVRVLIGGRAQRAENRGYELPDGGVACLGLLPAGREHVEKLLLHMHCVNLSCYVYLSSFVI